MEVVLVLVPCIGAHDVWRSMMANDCALQWKYSVRQCMTVWMTVYNSVTVYDSV
jgi:hypothetical protein